VFPVTTSGGGNKRSEDAGMWSGKKPMDYHAEINTGSAARFFAALAPDDDDATAARLFYCAKASKRDRDEGLKKKEVVTLRDDLTEDERAYVISELVRLGFSLQPD
jgi:hypothetical protein